SSSLKTRNKYQMVQANAPSASTTIRFDWDKWKTMRLRPYDPNKADTRTNTPMNTSLPPSRLKIQAIGASRANCAYRWTPDPGCHTQPLEQFPIMSARELRW